MSHNISNRNTILVLLTITCIVTIFHILILTQTIPHQLVWGGKITNFSEIVVMEIISIIINLLFGFTLLIKASLLPLKMQERIINGILWFYCFLFLFNTIGNLFAQTYFEKSLSLITLLIALLLLKVLCTPYKFNENFNQ